MSSQNSEAEGPAPPSLAPVKRLRYATGKDGARISSPIHYAEGGLSNYLKEGRNQPGSLNFLPLKDRTERDRARFWAMWTRSQQNNQSSAYGHFDE
jgi:hypothetical protein